MPIFVVVVTATCNPCAASSFAVVIMDVVLPPLPINDTTSPRQIWSFSVRGHIGLRLKLRIRHSRFMRAGILYIREYGRAYPFCCGQTAGQSDMNRLEREPCIQGKSGLRRVLSSDNSEGTHKSNIIGRFLPTGKPLFLAAPLSLIRCSKQGKRRVLQVFLSVNILHLLFFYG